jgi:hypothetical protein
MPKSVMIMATVALFIMPTSAIKLQSMSLTNSSKLQNCTWLLGDGGLQLMDAKPSVWRATVSRLEIANISCIIVWAGWWNPDHTIKYAASPTAWTQFIDTVKAVDPNFVVLALVNGWGVDISNSTYSTAMLTAVQQLLASAPFDGLNDDLENFTGSNQNLIDYWQAEASMVHDMGKIATVDLTVGWAYNIEDVYPYLTNFDYVMPMFYSTIENVNALSYWNMILSNSPVPVIMGLDVDHDDVKEPFSQQLSWINEALNSSQHSNLVGFSIWAYDYWSKNDFATWTNWVTNGSVLSPTSTPYTPSEAIIITVTIIAVVSAAAVLWFRKIGKKSTAEPK